MLWLPVKKHCSLVESITLTHSYKDVSPRKQNAGPFSSNSISSTSYKQSEEDSLAVHWCPACTSGNITFASLYGSKSKISRKLVISQPKTLLVTILVKCIHHRLKVKKMLANNSFIDLVYCIPCVNALLFYRFLYNLIFTQIILKGDKILLRSSSNYMLGLRLRLVLVDNEYRHHTWDVLLDVAVACYLVALSNINFIDGIKETTTSITSTAMSNTATFGIEQAAQIVGNTAASTAVAAVVDVAISSAMLYMAKRQRDEGVISDKEFTTRIKKTVFKSTLKIAAGATGSIIGQAVIPVPVLGGLVGGFCGSLIGTGIAKGISYGLFDRNEKKEETAKKENEEYGMKAKLYHRKFRGHIPKITIYNDNKKQFEEKYFEKEMSKYLKHQFMKKDFGISLHGQSVIELKDFKSPLPRRKAMNTVKHEVNETEGDNINNLDVDDTIPEQHLDFMKKWKVMKQTISAMPKKKPLLLKDTEENDTDDLAITDTDFISLMHVNELAEESFIDASAVIITDKNEQESLSSTISIGKENLYRLEVQSNKSLSLSNITLKNFKQAFSVKKNKQEKQQLSNDETNHDYKDIIKDISLEELNNESVISDKSLDQNNDLKGKRNFMENFFQQIKHGAHFRVVNSGDENSKIGYEEENVTGDPIEIENNEVNRKESFIDKSTDEKDLSIIKSTDGVSGKNWQHLFKIFKEQRELETEGYKNLVSESCRCGNQETSYLVDKLSKKSNENDTGMSEKNDDNCLTIDVSESLCNKPTLYEDLVTKEDDDSKINIIHSISADIEDFESIDDKTRKSSFLSYCHGVYDQLERKVHDNFPNKNAISPKEKQNIPISLNNLPATENHRLSVDSKPITTEEKFKENPSDRSEVTELEPKKKSMFERVKSMSKKCLYERGNK